jgi:putative ABC transport system ATP-binding protein
MTMTETSPAPLAATATVVAEAVDAERSFCDGDNLAWALRGVSLSVHRGEFVAITGASGSGKTTLLNLLGGLDVPTAGDIRVAGRSLSALSVPELASVRRRHVGYVFQRLNLLATLSAVENVMLPLELDGEKPKVARAAALEQLAAVGLDGYADRYPDELSGGQQQRVAIARALTGQRSVLLADEPTGALDTSNGEAIIELLAKQCERGCAVVLVTHEPRFASYADRNVHLRDGAIVQSAGPITLGGGDE